MRIFKLNKPNKLVKQSAAVRPCGSAAVKLFNDNTAKPQHRNTWEHCNTAALQHLNIATPQHSFLNALLYALCALLLWSPSIVHAELGDLFTYFQPYISVQEEYNSNIDLTPTNRREDYITTISPGFRLSTMPRSEATRAQQAPTAEQKFGMDLDFNAGFVFYARENDNNFTSLNGSLNAWYSFSPKLSFRVRDYLIRSDDIREADFSATAIEGQTLISRTTRRIPYYRNVFEPSVEYRFGGDNIFGFNYRNNIYRIDSRLSEDSMENYISPRLSYWFNIRNGFTLDYGLTLADFERSPDFVGHAVTGRYTYRFNPRTSVYGEYTYLLRDFEPPSNDYDVHRPSLGISHSFSPTLSGSAGVGYYWENPDRGSTTGGVYYNVSLSQRAEKTTYTISFQGGYTEEYFTAENLGFTKYYSGIGTISHQLLEKVSVGVFSSYEWTKHSAGQIDRILGVGGNASYQIWRFLLLSLDVSHRENHSTMSDREYTEYSGTFRITASF